MSYALIMIVSEHLNCVKADDIQNARSTLISAWNCGVFRYFHTEREDSYGAP